MSSLFAKAVRAHHLGGRRLIRRRQEAPADVGELKDHGLAEEIEEGLRFVWRERRVAESGKEAKGQEAGCVRRHLHGLEVSPEYQRLHTNHHRLREAHQTMYTPSLLSQRISILTAGDSWINTAIIFVDSSTTRHLRPWMSLSAYLNFIHRRSYSIEF